MQTQNDQTDATQAAASTVDGQAQGNEGQSATFVPKDDSAQQPAETAEQKKERISQKKWQDMTEKVKKAEERDAKILQALGIKPEEGQEIDPVVVLTQTITDMKADGLRKEFEAKFPKVLSEKYAEAWKKVVKDKNHLVQSGELAYEDLWKMIRDEGEYQAQDRAVRETQKEESESFNGSVPFFGSSVGATGSDKLSAMDKEIAKGMGWTEKNYESAGAL